MKKTIIISYLFLVTFAGSLLANEINIFSARHYDSDVQLYKKFTVKTGIKVNVVSGKSGALEKRIIEEGADSQADLYITADAGRLGAFETYPFDKGTNKVASFVSSLTKQKKILSVAGGGDTVSALNNAKVLNDFSYVSTAGGAFLEWLEGKLLPGIEPIS